MKREYFRSEKLKIELTKIRPKQVDLETPLAEILVSSNTVFYCMEHGFLIKTDDLPVIS